MLASGGLLTGDEEAEGEAGPRVLDLYAGSGALAFEALSRGASSAVLVEHARDAVLVIKQNAKSLGAETLVTLFDTKVDRAFPRIKGPFGVIFLDPPYADVKAVAFGNVLASAAALLDEAGALVLEHASADEPPLIVGLELDRTRRYGDTTLTLYRHARAERAGETGEASEATKST
jgi:16S rRNA (guanine966-N2)-methyltransferase